MPKIRVLIVDDSVVVRRLLSLFIASDPGIEVVGTAPDGQICLAKISQLSPDIVILDIEMPVMDGLQALAEIRKTNPKLPVIMFSTLTERGAKATLDALSLGASDYSTKPSQGSNGLQSVCAELILQIKELCSCTAFTPAGPPKKERSPHTEFAARTEIHTPIDIVVIGSSTGGPNALSELIKGLKDHFPVPILIVQHMPEIFTRLLAERLAKISGMPVAEGKAGEVLRPGQVWVAPGESHMDVIKDAEGLRLRIHKGPLENSCRPAVDVLFRSVAQIYGPRALAVILTGMGQDGLQGCRLIREAGGRVLAQDEASSVVWGMPGSVTRAGLPDKVLPLKDIAGEINRLVSVRSCRPLARLPLTTPVRQAIPVEAL